MRRAPALPLVGFGLVFSALIAGGMAPASGAEPAASSSGAKAKPKPVAKGKTAPRPATSAEVTLKGQLTCAKCGLHESSTCQSVLVVKDGDKDVKYYLARNAVADAQHEKVCGGSVPVTITGLVTEEGGRRVLTASAVTPR